MYQIKIKSTNYQEKNCFSLIGEENAEIYSAIFCRCNSDQNFDAVQTMLMTNEHKKKILSGKEVSVGALIMADDYAEKGKKPSKQLLENFRRLVVKHDLMIYPSSNINYALKEKLTKSWDFTVPFQEPDYVSLFIAVTTCLEKKELKSFYIDSSDLLNFENLLEKSAVVDVHNPDIYITTDFVDGKKVKEILKLNPKVIFLFGNADVDTNYINEFRKRNINLVPTALTQMGNFIFAEGIYKKNRTIDESFRLINVGCKKLNETLWHFSLNSRKSVYDVVDEIFQAHVDENARSSFRLDNHDVGAMLYRA